MECSLFPEPWILFTKSTVFSTDFNFNWIVRHMGKVEHFNDFFCNRNIQTCVQCWTDQAIFIPFP